VGGLQLIGGLGMLIGMCYIPFLHAMSAAGLAVLMTLGFIVRIKIKDSIIQALPSLGYALLNTFIFYYLR